METRRVTAEASRDTATGEVTTPPSLPSRRHYRFEDASLCATVAHGGVGEIHTRRVEEAARGAGVANFVDLTVMPPGTSIGVHTHGPGDEEVYVVVSGSGRMRLEGEEFAVGPGDVVVNGRRGTHGLVNTSAEDLRLVVVEIPAGPPGEGRGGTPKDGGRRMTTGPAETGSHPPAAPGGGGLA